MPRVAPDKALFQAKSVGIFLISASGTSNDYPQHTFSRRKRKNIFLIQHSYLALCARAHIWLPWQYKSEKMLRQCQELACPQSFESRFHMFYSLRSSCKCKWTMWKLQKHQYYSLRILHYRKTYRLGVFLQPFSLFISVKACCGYLLEITILTLEVLCKIEAKDIQIFYHYFSEKVRHGFSC